ncbi:DUF4157 domain-containing protein [Flavobacterium artemisiae]|uniref:DUF4157 domain-containing protein n=1 Tax=Flavobacterium artemisiae TaxID=2126556 RepID=A0ABW4HGA4_9FLAO
MRAFENRKTEKHSSSTFFGPKIQKKIKTGTAGDQFEVEADRVADKVVNNNSSRGGLLQSKEEVQQKPISETITSVQNKDIKEEKGPVQKKSDKKEEEKPVQKKGKEDEKEPVQKKSDKKEEEKPVQKKGKEEEKEPVQKKENEEEKPVQKKEEKEEQVQKCAECEKEEQVQKKEQNGESEIQDNELEGKLNNSKGGGSGLDKKTKQEMETGFGNDFSNVKIHTDSNAVQMSEELGAQAFTNGNDVYFNKNKYNPDSKEGKHLLAHELTHTIQQTGAVQKSVDPNGAVTSEDLESPRFKGDFKLEQAHDDLGYLTTGSKGESVKKVQSGLMDLGYKLPKFGADGDFGSETRAAVINFQSDNDLANDGVVGVQTIGRLDDIYVGRGKGKGKGKDKDKKKKPPKKKNCGPLETFTFSSEPVAIQTLEADADCKTFSIVLATTKNGTENYCPTYNVEITDSSGKSFQKGALSVGKSVTLVFIAPKPGIYHLIISTSPKCGADAFSGIGTKQRKK